MTRAKLALTLAVAAILLIAAGTPAKKHPKKGSIKFGSKNQLSKKQLLQAKNTSNAFVEVAKAMKPCVVSVSSSKFLKTPSRPFNGSPFDYFFGNPRRNPHQAPQEKEYRQEGLGSGVIVSAEGYIITNNHVVEGADEIVVTLFSKKEVEAELIGADKESDIAVLKLKEKIHNLPAAPMGNSADLAVGEWVLAIGNPFSKQFAHTVTAGIVSATGRSAGINFYENFIQTDAAINRGNSGGALVNLRGELIGINTAIVSGSGGNVGIGFAIPINMAKKVMEDLLYYGKVSRGWLGIHMQHLDKNLSEALGLEDNRGVLVQKVMPDSPAEKGGLKSGDVVLTLDGVRIKDMKDLQNRIGNSAPNTIVTLKIIRNKKEKKIKVDLGERPSDVSSIESENTQGDDIGLTVKNLSSEFAQKYELDPDEDGALVTFVKGKSVASSSGVRVGDLIQRVGDKTVKSASDYKKAIKKLSGERSILLYIKRGSNNLYIGLKNKKEKKD